MIIVVVDAINAMLLKRVCAKMAVVKRTVDVKLTVVVVVVVESSC